MSSGRPGGLAAACVCPSGALCMKRVAGAATVCCSLKTYSSIILQSPGATSTTPPPPLRSCPDGMALASLVPHAHAAIGERFTSPRRNRSCPASSRVACPFDVGSSVALEQSFSYPLPPEQPKLLAYAQVHQRHYFDTSCSSTTRTDPVILAFKTSSVSWSSFVRQSQ
jgi:hypothetical protein